MPFITNAQKKGIEQIDSLAKYFLKYEKSLDKEKILLQTDRHIYTTREKIYFKLFPIDSITKQLTARPKKLYVDLVNNQDKVFGQLLLNASDLKTSGEFVLNDSLQEGYYWIRAYTEKMISENLNDITVVPVYIVNPRKRSFEDEDFTKESDSAAIPRIQIFPEGGNMISGINTTVGLKVTDQHGNPMLVQGIVKDTAGSVFAKFTTNSDGLSKFSFEPIPNDRYSILVWNKNRFDSVAVLPPINFYAGQIAVLQQTDDSVKVRILLEDSIYSKDYTTYLLGISTDSICYSAIGKGMYEVEIPLKNFSHGINSLLLFNTKNQLLSKRDIFIKKENYHISIRTDKDNYRARENVKVDVTITDKNNKPLLAALTFAVTDIGVTDTAISYEMNDKLKNLSSEEAADLAMLTHKNEYLNWSATDTINHFQKAVQETAHEKNQSSSFEISGTVLTRKNVPVADKIVTIFSNKNSVLPNTDTTDINGRFQFYFTDLNDSTRFVVQVSNLKGIKEDKYTVVFDTVSMPRFITPGFLKKKFVLDEESEKVIQHLLNIDSVIIGTGKEWLKPVILKRYQKKEVTYDESKRVSPFSHIITPEMINRGAQQIGNALLMIPRVQLAGHDIKIDFKTPLLLLDGIEPHIGGESMLDFINSIPVFSIDFIEVLTGPQAAIYGMRGANGVILINTTTHPHFTEIGISGLPSFYPRGFHTAQSFVMPDYNNKETRDSKMPDLRKTIYWNGDIITNKEGKASVNFFTADAPSTYVITITGISENGDKIYKTFTINRR
jgi:TonB-dependent SusC/RagA subfamily outer membrane receptor